MATLAEIINYVTTTPQNINPNVLRSLLENSDTEDEGMPAGAIKTFSFNVPVNNGELDDITVDDLIAIEGKGVKLFVDDIEIASITDDTDAFYGEDCYIKSNKYYYGTVTITKEGAVTIEETELEGK